MQVTELCWAIAKNILVKLIISADFAKRTCHLYKIWRITKENTPGKNLISATCVQKNILILPRWCFMSENIQEKNPTSVVNVMKLFSEKSRLSYHLMKVHTGQRPFPCTECEKAFILRGDLNYHMKKVHTGERPFPCSLCDESFILKNHLDYHMKKVHTGERYTCGTCNKSFVLERNLKYHNMNLHTGEKPFPCRQCDRAFVNNAELQRHIRRKIHQGESRFSCRTCDKVFNSDFDLQAHIKNCMNFQGKHDISQSNTERPFRCSQSHCGKSFQKRSRLDVHIRLHTGEKPHQCINCHERFRRMRRWKKHAQKHLSLT